MSGRIAVALLTAVMGIGHAKAGESLESFCLDGSFDLGLRLQGRAPGRSETYPMHWCITVDPASDRVRFSAGGRSNPDMAGDFTVDYLPPDRVRIVNDDGPNLVFEGAIIGQEAARHRRIDPRYLAEEIGRHPEWVADRDPDGVLQVRYPGSATLSRLWIADGRLQRLETSADLPLRGRVPVVWRWDWSRGDAQPRLELSVDGEVWFRAAGQWRPIDEAAQAGLWADADDDRAIPGAAWPSRVAMNQETLAPGVHWVRSVRTGFNHLVIETDQGLVVADAPAGWVEIQQIPPEDLVPGLGISGLSERFVDYLGNQFPGQPIRAVALTHGHDDHAGGARAFAAAGAEVYAPAEIAEFLSSAFNRSTHPTDRLAAAGGRVQVQPVEGSLQLDDPERPVRLLSMGAGPHVDAALGVWVESAGVFFQSDLHVPNSDSPTPREERLTTECWFARWAVDHLPETAAVINSHSGIQTPVARLKQYRDSPGCAD